MLIFDHMVSSNPDPFQNLLPDEMCKYLYHYTEIGNSAKRVGKSCFGGRDGLACLYKYGVMIEVINPCFGADCFQA